MNKGLRTVAIAASSLAIIAGTLVPAGCSSSSPHGRAGRRDDATISTKVESDLLRERALRGCEVSVTTHEGTVELNGWVNSPEQKREAEAVARSVKGVVAIQNNLAFKESAGAERHE